MSHDLSLGDTETAQLYALLSIHELSDRCTVTNQKTLKEVLWSATDPDVHLLLYSDLCTEELVKKNVYFMQLLTVHISW